jgi:restriction endonuclease S subunit
MLLKDIKRFVKQRSELTPLKLFVEFYQPKDEHLINTLKKSAYELIPLKNISVRMFDGPFGSNRKVDMYQDNGIPYIRVKDVLPDGISSKHIKYISQEKHKELLRSRVVPGNLLITIAGRVGTAAVFPESLIEGNITGHIAGLEIPEDINPFYIAAFMNSWLGQFQIKRWSHRTTRPELNLKELGEILISKPPRPIQDKIAEITKNFYLEAAKRKSDAIKLLSEIPIYMKEYLGISDVIIEDMARFTIKRNQIHRADVRYFLPQYTYLENILENSKYPLRTIEDVCTKVTSGFTPAKEDYTETGYAVIKVGSLNTDWTVKWDETAFTSEKCFQMASKAYLKQGDILILAASHQLNYIGKTFALLQNMPSKFEGACMCVGELIMLRANEEEVLPEYLLACLTIEPIQQLINRLSRGQSAHLYPNDLKKLKIPLPPKPIQREIVAKVESKRIEARRILIEAREILKEADQTIEKFILGEPLS